MPREFHMTRRAVVGSALGLATLHAPRAFRAPASATAASDTVRPLAITHVTVLSMEPDAAPQPDMTVIIMGERITAIEPAALAAIPDGAMVVDGRGKWLMPGLMDLHVHFISQPIPLLEITPADILTPYLAHGVLQILDMAATPESNLIRDAVAAGEIVAPFVATGAMIDGDPPMRPGSIVVAAPEDAEAVVEEIAGAGFDFIKVYSRLSAEAFAAVLAAAESAGIRVIGHLPGSRQLPLEALVRPGFAMISHAEELTWLAPDFSDATIGAMVALLQENGTAVASTLFLDEQILAQTRDPEIVGATEGLRWLHPVELMLWFEQNPYIGNRTPERITQLEAMVEFNARLIRALVAAGVPVLAGTDAAFIPGLPPGLSLHRELEALVAAGLTPGQALAAATSVPAAWLGVAGDRGTVEVGKRGRLVLLEADPLSDIRNTRAIAAVIVNGEVLEQPELAGRLAALDATYAPYRAFFSPQGAAAIDRQEATR